MAGKETDMEFKFKELPQRIQANMIRERIRELVAGDDICCEMISSFNQQFPHLMIYPTTTIRNLRQD
jgi:hypothetical protein